MLREVPLPTQAPVALPRVGPRGTRTVLDGGQNVGTGAAAAGTTTRTTTLRQACSSTRTRTILRVLHVPSLQYTMLIAFASSADVAARPARKVGLGCELSSRDHAAPWCATRACSADHSVHACLPRAGWVLRYRLAAARRVRGHAAGFSAALSASHSPASSTTIPHCLLVPCHGRLAPVYFEYAPPAQQPALACRGAEAI